MGSFTVFTVPVMPYVATFDGVEDVVLSLVGIAPTQNIRMTAEKPDPVTATYQKADLKVVQTNASVLGHLGFPGVVDLRVSTKVSCSYMDLLATRKVEMPPGNDKNNLIVGATFGLGFRMAIIAYDIDANTTSSFSGIAASAKLKLGSTNYQILPIGGGLTVLEKARPLITNLAGEFTIETLEAIGAVEYALADLYINHHESMTAELVSVDIDIDRLAALYSGGQSRDYMSVMQGQSYALQQAYRNVSLVEAIEHGNAAAAWPVPTDRDPSPNYEAITKDFYSRILQLKPDQKPAHLKESLTNMAVAGL